MSRKIALPLLVGNMFQQLYNMVDSIVGGRFVGTCQHHLSKPHPAAHHRGIATGGG